MVPRSPRVQVSWGGQIPLSRPRLGGTPRSWWPLGCRLRSQLHPHPQEGRQHRALAPPGGEDNCQVIRFKFKIIKITIQNKKTNPCHKQTLKPATPAPSTHKKGHQQGLWGWQAGPARGVSSSLRGQRSGAAAGMSRGAEGLRAPGSVSVLGSLPPAHLVLSVFCVSVTWTGLALEIYCTVLEEAWGRGRAGAVGEAGGRAGGGHRLVLESSRIFQITRCMQALASSLELCPSTLSWMICLR